ncbi:4'-phosphopantetheinyl transferase superfamily protein [Dickeya fangzhongdai]|uniref:4'-phosphopantetheinyl transferase family protein n=1 Tax=Dickeya fangzhongdai TaxID=1778540 RepID=UPI002B316E4C|nr:4'-phosphopantetheinyl transferase superfamily protein [Dickeya fangzhongdai]
MTRLFAALPHTLRRHLYFASQTIEVSDAAQTRLLNSGLTLPASLNRAVLKRRVEFLSGRACAREALRLAGLTVPDSLLISPHRHPVWPVNIVGSISHCNQRAFAVVAHRQALHSVGMDIEECMTESALDSVRTLIAKPQELRLAAQTGLAETLVGTLLFSAKESLFKALFADVQRIFDFSCAQLTDWQPSRQYILLTLTQSLSPTNPQGKQLCCYYHCFDSHVLTLCLEPQPGLTPA